MIEPKTQPRPAALPAPSDRWTKLKMAQFLRELASSHSVSAACKAVGMSRQAAYKLRARLKGEPFDIAWEVAFQHGYDALHQAAQQLGRYRSATDFWSERWDILLDQVENGHVLWDREEHQTLTDFDRSAAAASSRYTAPDPLPRGRGQ